MPETITQADLRRITEPWRVLAPMTRHNYHSRLRLLLKQLDCPEPIRATVLRVPNQPPRVVVVQPVEMERMLASSPPDLRPFLLLCSDMAIRSGTARRIAEKDWCQDTGELHFVTKKGAVVTLPATERVVELIGEALRYEGNAATPLIDRLAGLRPRSHKYYGYAVAKLRKALGMERATPHDMRRSQARRLYASTKDLRLVQNLLGHRDLTSTFHYLHPHIAAVSGKQLEVAAEGGSNAKTE